MKKKMDNLHSFDDIMDAQFGAPGSPEREQFNKEAEAYSVGVLICEARKREKMTQATLANLVGADKSYISKIENGVVDPSASLFLRIMRALGLRVDIVKPIEAL